MSVKKKNTKYIADNKEFLEDFWNSCDKELKKWDPI